jgi:ABC-type sugar transport system substrate-binding protein
MSIDLTPLVQALAALALAATTAATPYLVPLIQRYLHVRLTASQAAAIRSAADAGAQAAYGYIATNASSYRDLAIRDTAIAKGVQHVVASTPEALTALGVTPEHVRSMVEARFGGLLAADPTVSIGRSPTA